MNIKWPLFNSLHKHDDGAAMKYEVQTQPYIACHRQRRVIFLEDFHILLHVVNLALPPMKLRKLWNSPYAKVCKVAAAQGMYIMFQGYVRMPKRLKNRDDCLAVSAAVAAMQ